MPQVRSLSSKFIATASVNDVSDKPSSCDFTALLEQGGKEAAVILAIAAVILAIAQLLKVLVPVMTRRPRS